MAKRRRTKQTTKKMKRTAKDWTPAFLASLRTTANIFHSALAAGVGRATVYERRNSDDDFALAMAQAIDDAVDDLEMEARRRARHGLLRVKFHQGQPIMVHAVDANGEPLFHDDGRPIITHYAEHEYSDTLMIFLLKAHRPEKYREHFKHEVSGPSGGPMKHEHTVTARISTLAVAIEKEVDREEASNPPGDGAGEPLDTADGS